MPPAPPNINAPCTAEGRDWQARGGWEKRSPPPRRAGEEGDQGAQPMRTGAGTGRLKGNGWGPLALVPEHPEVQGQRRRAEPQACTPRPPAPAPAPAPARLCPGLPGSLRISARASLKRWRGLRSREADSWKVPGKRPPQRRGGAGGGRRGGGERGRRAGLGSRAHPRLRGQAFNSCRVSPPPPPPRLAGPGLPLKHEPSLPPPPPTLRAGRGPCEPGLRASSGRQIPCAPSPEACGRRSVGDRVCEGLGHTTTTLPEFGEGEPAACSPLPLRHHFGHPAETRFGIPRDFQERTRGPLAPPARATTCP